MEIFVRSKLKKVLSEVGGGGGDGGAASWGGGAVDGGSVNAFLAVALTRVMRATVPIPTLLLLLCCILLLLVDLS